MSYYNLEQTIKIFQDKLPETLLPFDLPQLADLCRRKEITPVFPYDRYINEGLANERELPTYLKKLTKSFNGYLTLPDLTNLLFQPTNTVATSTAYIYEEIGKDNEGTFVSLEDYGYDRDEDYYDGHDSYDSGDLNLISINDLLFPTEQVQTYISSKHNKELDKSMAPATIGTFGKLTVAHGEPKTYEQLVEALTAANTKIRQQEEEINRLNEQLREQADKHLYDWQAMNQYNYPPELHLAMLIWEKSYILNEISNQHIKDHSQRFNIIAEKIGLDKTIHGGALISRLSKITNPQINKQKGDIEKLKIIKELNIKDLDNSSSQG